MDYAKHKRDLLAILQAYAPDGEAQEKCAQFLHNLERTYGPFVESDQSFENYVIIGLVNAIKDGLDWDNWLWLFPVEVPADAQSQA